MSSPAEARPPLQVLVVKTSSLGDVVHTLPALTDAARALPGIRFDWVVEEAFAEIPARHPSVRRVLPCALRRWRKAPLQTWQNGEWRAFSHRLRAERYDRVIDAQGLIKSALITRMANGPKAGLDRNSAREPLSARVLDDAFHVSRDKHAIARVRELFAAALGYPVPEGPPDAGLPRAQQLATCHQGAQLIFFHGTTWATKHWPEPYWHALARLASEAGSTVLLPWVNDIERARAEAIARDIPNARVLPRMTLGELLDLILTLDGFIAVDTGLAHLAAAAGLPGVALYGPTDPALTGVEGPRAVSLVSDFSCAPCRQQECRYQGPERGSLETPCFSTLPAEKVWQRFSEVAQR